MDGPALMGLPTLYLTREHNVRLGKWVGAVPGYQEVVREPGYFAIIRTTLHQWQQCPHGSGRGIIPPQDSALLAALECLGEGN